MEKKVNWLSDIKRKGKKFKFKNGDDKIYNFYRRYKKLGFVYFSQDGEEHVSEDDVEVILFHKNGRPKGKNVLVYMLETPEVYGNLKHFCKLNGINHESIRDYVFPFKINGIALHRVPYIGAKNNIDHDVEKIRTVKIVDIQEF